MLKMKAYAFIDSELDFFLNSNSKFPQVQTALTSNLTVRGVRSLGGVYVFWLYNNMLNTKAYTFIDSK